MNAVAASRMGRRGAGGWGRQLAPAPHALMRCVPFAHQGAPLEACAGGPCVHSNSNCCCRGSMWLPAQNAPPSYGLRCV